MNGTENRTAINWTKTPDGGWEAMIKGVTYLIEQHCGRYYLYKGVECNQIDSHTSLHMLMDFAERF